MCIRDRLIPALVYISINFKNPETITGWAIPSATDIAFSLGVLSLLGKRVPVSLKVFLTALAIIDDLGAIVIIAFFYSGNVQFNYLLLMLVCVIILIALNKFNVRNFIPYLFVGILLWEFTHQSGIHATIAGVLLALTIPHKDNNKTHKNSLLEKIEHSISPYVLFGIMPIFAFANAGVSLEGINLSSLLNPVPLGILCGLFFGKQLGVFLFSYISIILGVAQMPSKSNWISLYGVGILTGIGFTMSLFVGNLAFVNDMQYMDHRPIEGTRIYQWKLAVNFISQKPWLGWGAGPRAGLSLILAAKAHALLNGKNHVGCSDVAAVAPPIFRHRLIPNFAAQSEGLDSDAITAKIIEAIPQH